MINADMDQQSDIIDITGESPEMRGRSDEDSSRRHARYYSPKRNAEKRASFERKRRSFEARRQSGSGTNIARKLFYEKIFYEKGFLIDSDMTLRRNRILKIAGFFF